MVKSNLTESELEKLALAQHLNPNQVFPYLLQVPEFKAQYSSPDKPEESQYILLPQHNLYVAKERTLHGKDWYECHAELHKQNSRMLTLREFADFLLLLKSGKAEDGLKNKISKSDLQSIYLDITEVRNPYRAEWLDAKFEEKNGILKIYSNHRTKSKKVVATNSEPLETCIMKNCKVELSSFNKQGMPTKEGTDLSYWYPADGKVAWFYSDFGLVCLNCGRDPADSNSALRVRAAKIFHKK